jgi:hypothetical protein
MPQPRSADGTEPKFHLMPHALFNLRSPVSNLRSQPQGDPRLASTRRGAGAQIVTPPQVADRTFHAGARQLQQEGVAEIGRRLQAGSQVTRRTPVQLGVRSPGWVEVVDGLSAGDLVVTAGQQRIRKDGTEVRVVELGKQGNGGAGAAPARPASGASGAATGAGPKAAAVADAPAPSTSAAPASPSPVTAPSVPSAMAVRSEAQPLPGANPCQPAGSSTRSTAPGHRAPV